MKQHKTKAKVQQTPVSKPATPVKSAISPALPPDWKAIGDQYLVPALAVLLLVAAVLRATNLTALSLWVDEFVHVQRARQVAEGTGPLFTDDNNGILLTLLQVPFFKVFGTSVFWARFVSVVFGVGTVWMVYLLGQRLFNRYVGFLAAFASAFSLYLIFWSRMSRNYAIFGFFFLWAGYLFVKAFDNKTEPAANGFLARYGIDSKSLLLLPVALMLSLFSHQLTFFFLFTVGIFALLQTLAGMLSKTASTEENRKYGGLALLTLPFLLLVFIPPLSDWIRQPLSGLALSKITDLALPQWSRIGQLWAEKPWESFGIYNGVLRYSPTLLYFAGLPGFVMAFRERLSSALWLACSLLVPLILMSFIFREPALPRYFIFAFPYLMIAAAVGLYFLWNWVTTRLLPDAGGNTAWILAALPFVVVLASVRWSELGQLVLARKLEGHVVDMNVAHWAFTNWREPCAFVEKNRQPGDVVMSTVPNAVSWYLRDDGVLWFRQNRFDTQSKRYVPNVSNPGANSAATFEDVVRTVQNNPRGWLLGDYYLDNIFTDEKTLLWIYQNMHYHPEASRKSGVMVFEWDNSRPKPVRQNFVVEVGSWQDRIQSREYHLTLPPDAFAQAGDQAQVTVRLQDVNSNREGVLLFNHDNAAWLPPAGHSVEEKTFQIPRAWLHPGENTVQLLYDTDRTKDPWPGFTLHFLSIR